MEQRVFMILHNDISALHLDNGPKGIVLISIQSPLNYAIVNRESCSPNICLQLHYRVLK